MADPNHSEKARALPENNQSTADERAGHASSVIVLTKDVLILHPRPVQFDPLDPLNWSLVQKHTILAIIMALYFMFTYITTTTVPSFPSLQIQYSLSPEQANWTVAIPALGLSIGPLLWSSVADIVGRRLVILAGTGIALASTIGCALAATYNGYMAARFFQGFGVSPAATVGLAVINDLFFEHERGQKVGLWVLSIDLGLLCGPLIGGFVALAGHIWIQWVTAVLFGVIMLAELAFLPETLYPRHLLLVKASQAPSNGATRKENAAESFSNFVISDLPRTKELGFLNLKPVPGMKHPKLLDTLIRFAKTFKYAAVSISVGTYCFAWYWWVLSVITMIPVAYANYSPQTQGLFFIGLIIGTLVSEIFFSGRMSDWLVIKLARRHEGVKTPEMRLWLAYPGVILSALGMTIWGVSIDQNWHWAVGQVAFMFFGAGIQMGNTAICSYIVDAYPLQSMAVVVFYAVMLNLSAFVDPFFIVPWVDNVGFTWTFIGHSIITMFFCIPVIVLLHIFGRQIRERNGEPDWVDPGFDGDSLDLVN
ncbi:putative transporter [Tolypocladium ophioglossoides CBS 100239]|uniref:Putative transporter n=1 Tax=Tolypocladium ophioglossoides (strain CBS 100239) TaxID=1163406 RepID=A0A0L0MZ56_TOLOC|nr:putative transporter [Tolypocladium ophioglossoides CBS 100239]